MSRSVSMQKRGGLILCVVFSALFFTQIGRAGLKVYAHDSEANLYTVDVETTVAELIGNTGIVFTDIAFDADEHLFGISNQNPYLVNMALYEIDPETASVSKIGDIGAGGFVNALVFDETGTLWAASDTSIITINPVTGAGTVISDSVKPYGSAGDLAQDPDLNLYLTTDSGMLIQIDRSDGSVLEIGSIPQKNVYGFATGDDDNMYGITSDNIILLIDPQTGAGSVIGPISAAFDIGNTNGTSFLGEAVPEPASLFILAAGTILTVISIRA